MGRVKVVHLVDAGTASEVVERIEQLLDRGYYPVGSIRHVQTLNVGGAIVNRYTQTMYLDYTVLERIGNLFRRKR